MSNIGKKLPGLKRVREKANLSQAALADLIGLNDKKAICNWEGGVNGCTKKI